MPDRFWVLRLNSDSQTFKFFEVFSLGRNRTLSLHLGDFGESQGLL